MQNAHKFVVSNSSIPIQTIQDNYSVKLTELQIAFNSTVPLYSLDLCVFCVLNGLFLKSCMLIAAGEGKVSESISCSSEHTNKFGKKIYLHKTCPLTNSTNTNGSTNNNKTKINTNFGFNSLFEQKEQRIRSLHKPLIQMTCKIDDETRKVRVVGRSDCVQYFHSPTTTTTPRRR